MIVLLFTAVIVCISFSILFAGKVPVESKAYTFGPGIGMKETPREVGSYYTVVRQFYA